MDLWKRELLQLGVPALRAWKEGPNMIRMGQFSSPGNMLRKIPVFKLVPKVPEPKPY